jgi:hypothetical protein
MRRGWATIDGQGALLQILKPPYPEHSSSAVDTRRITLTWETFLRTNLETNMAKIG